MPSAADWQGARLGSPIAAGIRQWETSTPKNVSSSEEAYSYGGPYGPIAITTHGVNMFLASMGGHDRVQLRSGLPPSTNDDVEASGLPEEILKGCGKHRCLVESGRGMMMEITAG